MSESWPDGFVARIDAEHEAALAQSREECERLKTQLGLVHSIASAVTLKRHGWDPAALHESLCNTGDFDTIGAREAAEMFERIAAIARHGKEGA